MLVLRMLNLPRHRVNRHSEQVQFDGLRRGLSVFGGCVVINSYTNRGLADLVLDAGGG